MAILKPIDPGHPYATTKHISFNMYKQQASPAPFGYEYFVSLPPTYSSASEQIWPLILFLHGAGESQHGQNDSYASLRHGVPKIILCYDRLKAGEAPQISIPSRARKSDPNDMSGRPVPAEICELVAEQFITVTPSLDMTNGYGWNAKVLTALLDEIVQNYRVDRDSVHVTGFSMGTSGLQF
jgi:predicted peptidase